MTYQQPTEPSDADRVEAERQREYRVESTGSAFAVVHAATDECVQLLRSKFAADEMAEALNEGREYVPRPEDTWLTWAEQTRNERTDLMTSSTLPTTPTPTCPPWCLGGHTQEDALPGNGRSHCAGKLWTDPTRSVELIIYEPSPGTETSDDERSVFLDGFGDNPVTPAQAREIAAVLLRAADLAEATQKENRA